MDRIYEHFVGGFVEKMKGKNPASERKIGAELKFPLVNYDGSAAEIEKVSSLWRFLSDRGWKPVNDPLTGEVVACRKKEKNNDTVSSCETGFCKTEFSLAYVSDLFELQEMFLELKKILHQFSEKEKVYFLGYGIQPVTEPGKHLLMKKSRTSVWDKVFGANRILPREAGDDVNIFTINATSHVHIDVAMEEAVSAVNVLNGFAGAQIALTAHSNIWKGRLDGRYRCVNEKFWDWWMPDIKRIGVPERPFKDMKDYIDTISSFKPVYVKRKGKPVLLNGYKTFSEYYNSGRAAGRDINGKVVEVIPSREDIDVHNTCYWYNARITGYYTVENRVNDQQPPEDILCVPALTLGIVSSLSRAERVIRQYEWDILKKARPAACEQGLEGSVDGLSLKNLARDMVEVARSGLIQRGKGEEVFIEPLEERLKKGRNPADETKDLFLKGGLGLLLQKRKI
jgi:glutamate--cysteine ligase